MKCLDLFCGAGGASEGYRQAGIEVAAVADNSEIAIESHKGNHRERQGYGCEHHLIDLSNPSDFIGYWTPGEFDLIHGSPPCPEFSYANNNPDPKKGMELVRSFEEIVMALQPRWWVMENVRGVLPFLRNHVVHKKKYLLCAADYGVPQIRYRAFTGMFPAPDKTHMRNGPQRTLDGRKLDKWISIRQALNLEGVIHTNRDQREDGSRQIRDCDEAAPAFTGKSGMQWKLERPVQAVTGTEYKYCGGETDKRRAGYVVGRQLTAEECQILQGFPDDYVILGNKTERYLQIGNAVPPPVTKAIGKKLLEVD